MCAARSARLPPAEARTIEESYASRGCSWQQEEALSPRLGAERVDRCAGATAHIDSRVVRTHRGYAFRARKIKARFAVVLSKYDFILGREEDAFRQKQHRSGSVGD